MMTSKKSFWYYSFVMVLVALFVFGLTGCQLFSEEAPNEQEAPPAENDIPDGEDLPIAEEPPVDEVNGEEFELSLHVFEGQQYINLEELAQKTGGTIEVDIVQGTIDLYVYDVPYFLIKEVPVVERNGMFLAAEWGPLFVGEEMAEETAGKQGVFAPVSFLSVALELEYELQQKLVSFVITADNKEAYASFLEREFQLQEYSADDLIEYFSFLTSPIPGAQISTIDSSLPGAARPYRHGVHEGFDWYTGGSEVPINLNTPVVSIADGVVVRADHDYVEMTRIELDEYLSLSRDLQETPTFILDKLRGRSVWVQHDNGIQMRYAHLSRIEEGLQVGEVVNQGDTLGFVGNSGTSYAVGGDTHGGLHLHADLLIYGELFWEHIDTPEEIRRVLQNALQ